MSLREQIVAAIADVAPPGRDASGGDKKNYTEALSHRISEITAEELELRGFKGVRAPGRGRDKQFMGGYGTKGVDV